MESGEHGAERDARPGEYARQRESTRSGKMLGNGRSWTERRRRRPADGESSSGLETTCPGKRLRAGRVERRSGPGKLARGPGELARDQLARGRCQCLVGSSLGGHGTEEDVQSEVRREGYSGPRKMFGQTLAPCSSGRGALIGLKICCSGSRGEPRKEPGISESMETEELVLLGRPWKPGKTLGPGRARTELCLGGHGVHREGPDSCREKRGSRRLLGREPTKSSAWMVTS